MSPGDDWTDTDVRVLREANVNFAQENLELRRALRDIKIAREDVVVAALPSPELALLLGVIDAALERIPAKWLGDA